MWVRAGGVARELLYINSTAFVVPGSMFRFFFSFFSDRNAQQDQGNFFTNGAFSAEVLITQCKNRDSILKSFEKSISTHAYIRSIIPAILWSPLPPYEPLALNCLLK